MTKLMIEAAVNEITMKEQNPHAPYGPEEIAREAIAAARAGAAIVHFHARHPDTGEQLWTDAETYAQAVRLIRKETNAVLYPTYPPGPTKEERISHIVALAADPEARFELATLDVGATNAGRYDPVTKQLRGWTYTNTHEDLIYFLTTFRSVGIAYNLGVRDIGHMRHIHTYMEMGLVESPVAIKIFTADNDTHGTYPDARGLMMYLDMLPPGATSHWFVTTYGESHTRMNMLAAAMGGHIRTGIGDNPTLDGKLMTNAEQVELAVDLAHKAGRDIATPDDARRMLGLVG